ncbi:patatin-like phospholipase family protein [Methylocystis sp. MJC1]|jgi:NTE family protein|nr:patatin-like phospholipase family protein [Methylocystis sp. MJC1]UZX13212.1 patatin-like phospholipase family protein [Methylocystis sp. MJC1]
MKDMAAAIGNPFGRRKIGLALSSGVARGWAHIGAIGALTRLGVPLDIVAGTSAGALIGACYLAKELEELERWALSLTKRRILGYIDLHFGRGSLLSGNRIVDEMRRLLGTRRVEDLQNPFVAVATDLGTGHEIWLQHGSLVEAVRASIALPGLLPPIESGNRVLADGALVDPLPVAPCRALGADLVIAINLNTDVIGKMSRQAATPRTSIGFDPMVLGVDDFTPERRLASATRAFVQQEANIPSLFGVMTTSLGIMQDRLTRSRLAGDPPDVHITPRVGHIGLLEFERAKEAIWEGEQSVERKRGELIDLLRAAGMNFSI